MSSKSTNPAFEAALVELDAVVAQLQRRYEMYFLGLERIEPAKEREDLRRALMALKREKIRNTALKFRLNTLWNKFLSYERMWNRTTKEIEEGRYHRDKFKARLRQKAREEAEQLSQQQGKAAAAVAKARGAGNGGAPGRPSDSISDAHLERLYNAFVTAKKRCKEDTGGLTLDAMRRSLDKQIPAIKAKHKAKAVDFKVVIKGGKAILKAVPR